MYSDVGLTCSITGASTITVKYSQIKVGLKTAPLDSNNFIFLHLHQNRPLLNYFGLN